jgi:CTP synthase
MRKPKYIFVVGGVMSSVGKGIAAASVGKIIQSHGYKVANMKADMYINLDAGTIRPAEHGEVFVGDDGVEADQDLGNYERFTGQTSTREDYVTTGQVYAEVIKRERNLEYEGEDVEVYPDIPKEIIRRIETCQVKNKSDVTIIEFGGTVGEYQLLPFLEAARMMGMFF